MADAHICDRCGSIIVATTNRQKIGYGFIDISDRKEVE